MLLLRREDCIDTFVERSLDLSVSIMRFSLYALLGIGLICQIVAADPVPVRIAVISSADTADLADIDDYLKSIAK